MAGDVKVYVSANHTMVRLTQLNYNDVVEMILTEVQVRGLMTRLEQYRAAPIPMWTEVV